MCLSCAQTLVDRFMSGGPALLATAAGSRDRKLLVGPHIRVCLQVWKFPKGINARDLKARLAESKQAEALGLLEEALPPQGPPAASISAASEKGLPALQPGSKGKLRQSLLVPGRESPRWLSLQQVYSSPPVHHSFLHVSVSGTVCQCR